MVISTANAKYSNEDDSESVDLAIVDGGGSSMMAGAVRWFSGETSSLADK